MNNSIIRILLADHQEIFRNGLRRLLEAETGFVVVGEAGNGLEALRLVQELQPDVLLLDLAMPCGAGLEVLKKLADMPEPVRTIALTTIVDKETLVAALQYGARGVVLKESATSMLFKCIRKVIDDEYWICREDVGQIVEAMRKLTQQVNAPGPVPANKFRLTRREMDIVAAVAAGESNKGIAERLSLSEDTVKHHVSNVFDKLGVFSRLELAVFAINHRLVKEIEIAS